jgi:hypothetical protein
MRKIIFIHYFTPGNRNVRRIPVGPAFSPSRGGGAPHADFVVPQIVDGRAYGAIKGQRAV